MARFASVNLTRSSGFDEERGLLVMQAGKKAELYLVAGENLNVYTEDPDLVSISSQDKDVAAAHKSTEVTPGEKGQTIRLVTLKLVGYTTVVSALRARLTPSSSVLLFGGMAKERPYPGSTTVTTVNGGVEGLTRSLVHELKPIRVNCIHPGIVGDSPYWEHRQAALDATRARTPTGRLVSMADSVAATAFLLESPALTGVELRVDGGLHAT